MTCQHEPRQQPKLNTLLELREQPAGTCRIQPDCLCLPCAVNVNLGATWSYRCGAGVSESLRAIQRLPSTFDPVLCHALSCISLVCYRTSLQPLVICVLEPRFAIMPQESLFRRDNK
jgi:hypothetical protein